MPDNILRHGFKEMLAEANAVIETISVQDLPYLIDDPDVELVDVRETVEREQDGYIPSSIHAPRGLLEFHADPESPIYNTALRPDLHLVLYCGTGGRSALAAKTLLDMGYKEVSSLAGGVSAWTAAGNRLQT
ncbi:MAG: rhodanese-like domain-containing protein [Rhizobiales bacterium]|nr:rhodanese-like domain-containing protein [Hyphomicrobiales bacterium]